MESTSQRAEAQSFVLVVDMALLQSKKNSILTDCGSEKKSWESTGVEQIYTSCFCHFSYEHGLNELPGDMAFMA